MILLFSLPYLVAAVLVTPALVLVLPRRNPDGAQVGATFLEKEKAHSENYNCQDFEVLYHLGRHAHLLAIIVTLTRLIY